MVGGENMTCIVDRTVSLVQTNQDASLNQEAIPLEDFDAEHGYVLLGEPGMGKTTEFSKASKRVAGLVIPVHRFIARDPRNHPEWRTKPLFLDGLDEARIGSGNPKEVINKVVSHLERLGTPRFRISCRSNSWLGANDLEEINSILDNEAIPVLQLNPLEHDSILRIISSYREDANLFAQQARDQGMGAFLSNPQLLNLLLRSVDTGDWRNSPTMIFENACKDLVRERILGYSAERDFGPPPSHNSVLRAAGRLSALMLIANKIGWSVGNSENDYVLSLRDVEGNDRNALHVALDSALFVGDRSHRTPLHRLFSEFLGAKYLHEKIQEGLSVQRVLSVLMGYDGNTLPDLRGLGAWLASFNPKARRILVHADPVAIAFNGDASSFSHGERRELLINLERSIDHHHFWPSLASLGALVGNQEASLVWELTGLPDRSEKRQILIYQLLRGVTHMYSVMSMKQDLTGDARPETIRKNLLNIVYDSSWREGIRCEALHALNLILLDNPNGESIFYKLLTDLQLDFLRDKQNGLRGMVLDFLYPSELPPSEVWDYLVNRTVEYRQNTYFRFWHSLVDRTPESRITELIDSLCNHASDVIPKLANHRLLKIVPQLLARGLELCGDKLCIPDLYRWFELLKFDIQSAQLVVTNSSDQSNDRYVKEANTIFQNWFSERATVQRKLILHDLITQESKINHDLTIGLKFVGRNPSSGFRSWCLLTAVEFWYSNPIAAEKLASWSVLLREEWGAPLSEDLVEQIVSGTPGLCEWNRRRLIARDQSDLEETEWKKKLAKIHDASRKRELEELEEIRKQQSELAKGNCSPVLLHRLATIYFDGLASPDEDPKSHLASYFDGDTSLVQASLDGFRSLLDRDQLPDLSQIAQLHERSKMSYFALPFLAGMEEENKEIVDHLSDRGRRRAVGFHLVNDSPMVPAIPRGENMSDLFAFYKNYCPEWYHHTIMFYPEAVADSLVSIHSACVRAKFAPNQYLYELTHNPDYSVVAKLAVRRMFSVFPTRCSGKQLEFLRLVLWSTIQAHAMSIEELKKLVKKRLLRKHMDTAQRAQWLCAGLVADHHHCLPLFTEFLSTGRESRIRNVLGFLVPDGGKAILQDVNGWGSRELLQLIQAVGKSVQRTDFHDGARIRNNMEFSGRKFDSLLTLLVQELTSRSDEESVEVLASLSTDPHLDGWKGEITLAQEKQSEKLRETQRPDLNIEQIQKTLQGGAPANSSDLAALISEVLEDLGDRIRNGQTDDWRQYWDWDHKKKRPTHPKHENECRDIPLSDLKEILRRYDIDAQPEGRNAEETRVDIRVSYGSDLSVPIEIKKNSHKKIWHGINDQLVPKYMRYPNSEGHGIYLVLWFGAEKKYMRMVSPRGGIPKNPEELKSMLIRQIDPELSSRIRVIVIDVGLRGRYAENENDIHSLILAGKLLESFH